MGLGAGWAPNTRAWGVQRGTASTVHWVYLDEAGQEGDEDCGAEKSVPPSESPGPLRPCDS